MDIMAENKRQHSPEEKIANVKRVASSSGVPGGATRGGHSLRIVSLQPSATEILALIGGAHLLVGRSHECDFPADATKDVPVVTSSSLTFESSGQVDTEVIAIATVS
jgi:ABC-type hemin transport system substrate-binding protein